MIGHRAREFFSRSCNCAQAVLKAFHETDSPKNAAQLAEFAACGGGRAPGGLCGALHGAHQLVTDSDQREELSRQFAELAGARECREIRRLKRLPCPGCVETAARLAARHRAPRPDEGKA